MDPRQISHLAKLLRDNGDRVLNSELKITLTGALLRALNDSFSLIVDTNDVCEPRKFQVLKPNNASSDVFRELQFIYDFVQKAQILCLTTIPNDDQYDGFIDISKFRNLQRLEIQRIPIEQIIGIQRLRKYLKEIICSRSINSVTDIISHCGGDKSNGFIWNELILADFSYNNLKAIDCSLEFASTLQYLNLSHNQIVSVDAIKWLPNLKKLNLSFNSLTHIPACIVSKSLQTLILSNNFIEDLSGLSRMDSLSELNLADNCILDHSALIPISSLIALQFLQLYGNPIAHHPHHREETAKYLHKNTASVKFVLDLNPFSKHERDLIGFNIRHISRRKPNNLFYSDGISTPNSEQQTKDNSPASSFRSSQFDEKDFTQSQTSLNQKKLRPRPAQIDDGSPDEDGDDRIVFAENSKRKLSIISVNMTEIGDKEHLKTKKQIEQMRKDYGNVWLQNIQKSETANENWNKSGITRDEFIDNFLHVPDEQSDNRTSTPISEQPSSSFAEQFQSPQTDYSLYKSAEQTPNTTNDTNESENTLMSLHDIYKSPLLHQESISDSEGEETVYTVICEPLKRELILKVTNQNIREKDPLTERTITKLNLSQLESSEHIKTDVLRLRFDTIKRDKKERTYTFAEGMGQKLDQFLRNILSKRPLSQMNQTIYRCIRCSTEFSREIAFKNNDVKCPACKNAYVVEIKEQVNAPITEEAFENSSIGSASSFNEISSKLSNASQSSFDSNQSLIGSTTNCEQSNDLDAYFASRFGGGADSDVEILSNPSISSIEVLENFSRQSSRKPSIDRRFMHHSMILPAQNQIVVPSALYKSVDGLELRCNDSEMKSSSNSDIEELPNAPSDSEDQTSQNGKNDNFSNGHSDKLLKKTMLTAINLTESSSSGSVTDSVCTAYEHQTLDNKTTDSGMAVSTTTMGSSSDEIKIDKIPSKIIDDAAENESIKMKETSSFPKIFSGIIQTTNILMSSNTRTTPPKERQHLCDPFKFSYTDFDNVDHRLKLFLYQNIFEDSNEHLKWLVKGRIYNDSSSTSETDAKLKPAIFVMSTTKWYILKIIGPEYDDVSKWLKRQLLGTIDRFETVRVLPWKIGLTFSIKYVGNVHLLLQDILRTDNLLLFFQKDNPLPPYCSLEYQISERLSQKLLKITDNMQLKMLVILNQCEISGRTSNESLEFVSIIITESNLYLTTSKYGWLADKLEQSIELTSTQLITNIAEVIKEKDNDCIFTIKYFNEIDNEESSWKCTFETSVVLDTTFHAIAHSWEKFFQVPLGN